MIEFIFTIDYEIFGNGEGSLRNHIFEPAQKLKSIFDQAGVKLIWFVEAAELEMIEAAKSDPAIDDVKKQIRDLYLDGHEIALHLHPQWYNGRHEDNRWILDNREYNLCVLPEQRIAAIVDRAIKYLRAVLSEPNFTPLSFRAGNWLFQPTRPAADILFSSGIKIDSSVFKGGRQHHTRLDYRKALGNGYFWKFHQDVNHAEDTANMIEIPIYSQMVPPWRMATKKRLALQQKAAADKKTLKDKIYRFLDLSRPFQPLKLDFCRMTIDEMTRMMELIIRDDEKSPHSYKPVAAIGHTKDLVDFETVEVFLSYLDKNRIGIVTLTDAVKKMQDCHSQPN
jgi:hypothetical protein